MRHTHHAMGRLAQAGFQDCSKAIQRRRAAAGKVPPAAPNVRRGGLRYGSPVVSVILPTGL